MPLAGSMSLATQHSIVRERSRTESTGGERCSRVDRAAELAICAQVLELAACNPKLGLLVLKLRNDGMTWTQVLGEVVIESCAPPKAES